MKINKEYLSYVSDKIKNGKIEGLSSYYKLNLIFDDNKNHKLHSNDLSLIADDIENGIINGEIKTYSSNKMIICNWNLEVDEIQMQNENILIEDKCKSIEEITLLVEFQKYNKNTL